MPTKVTAISNQTTHCAQFNEVTRRVNMINNRTNIVDDLFNRHLLYVCQIMYIFFNTNYFLNNRYSPLKKIIKDTTTHIANEISEESPNVVEKSKAPLTNEKKESIKPTPPMPIRAIAPKNFRNLTLHLIMIYAGSSYRPKTNGNYKYLYCYSNPNFLSIATITINKFSILMVICMLILTFTSHSRPPVKVRLTTASTCIINQVVL